MALRTGTLESRLAEYAKDGILRAGPDELDVALFRRWLEMPDMAKIHTLAAARMQLKTRVHCRVSRARKLRGVNRVMTPHSS